MELFTKEVYEDSAHYWIQANLMTSHEYGQVFNSQTELIEEITHEITQILREEEDYHSYYWYFGDSLSNILLMIRIQGSDVVTQINLKDFDFALNIDRISCWKNELNHMIKQKNPSYFEN